MQKEKRQSNYELLRIIAMWMVVTLHYLNHTGMLPDGEEQLNGSRIVALLLEAFCIVAVNLYVLISGYFLCRSGFRLLRLVELLGQIWFYVLLIPLAMTILGIETGWLAEGVYGLLPYVFPIQSEHYWFATSYVVLYLLTPILNAAVRSLSRRQLQLTIAGLLLYFGGIKSLIPLQLVTDRFGYDFGWFICVYLVGAYIRGEQTEGNEQKEGNRQKRMEKCRKKGFWLFIYTASCLLIFGWVLAALCVYRKTGSMAYLMALPFHYNFLPCLTGAIALFLAFSRIRLPEGRLTGFLCSISPLTFGVYLFHEHILIRSQWTEYLERYTGKVTELSVFGFLLHWFCSVLLIYGMGSLTDALRRKIFCFVGKYTEKTRLAKGLKKLERGFCDI